MRSAAVINNGLRRYVAYESVCRVLASMPHCSWFLPNAIFDYVHPYVHGFFGCFGQKPLPTSLTIEVCNHVQACCPARAYCS